MRGKIKNESYKHFFAKKVVASWFRDAARNANQDGYAEWSGYFWYVPDFDKTNFGVYDEFPMDLEFKNGSMWSDRGWPKDGKFFPDMSYFLKPEFSEGEIDFRELVISDVFVQNGNKAGYVIEIINKNYHDYTKTLFYQYLQNATVLYVNADWVMSQICRPECLSTMTSGEAENHANRVKPNNKKRSVWGKNASPEWMKYA